jgi:hypothetical protein
MLSTVPRFTRAFAIGILLLLAAASPTVSGCHDDSTGCCMICPSGMCACGNGCISCSTKCMMGSGCACNSTLPPAEPSQPAAAGAQMSESPGDGR